MPNSPYVRPSRLGSAFILLLLATSGIMRAQSPSIAAERSALRLPDALLRDVMGVAGDSTRALGYREEEMTWYGSDRHRLRSIELLFRDVRTIARHSGNLATQLVAAGGSPATVVRMGYFLTDVAAGRFLELSDSAGVGLPVADSAAFERAPLSPLADMRWAHASPVRLDPRALELPAPVQRLVARIVAGALAAGPWLDLAFADPSLRSLLDGTIPLDSLYRIAAAPWMEELNGQPASRHRAGFVLPRETDRDYLAFASAIFLTHMTRALDEYRATPSFAMPALATPIVFTTPIGDVRISGPDRDVLDRPVAISIDLGGDDVYHGRHAVGSMASTNGTSSIAALVDLGGNDTYDAAAEALGIATAVLGIAVVHDLTGDDIYRCRESGLAAAWYGTAVLVDDAGNDRYDVDSLWGQGVAHVGVGALIDCGGDDVYTCAQQSQAMGSTLGAGILLDVAGDDQYVARDDGNISALYLGQSVAMSQGCGYGRRADIGDGHSLAGGYGILVDGAGNDRYHATAWSQGCGYWWGAGFLEDLGGDDTYRNGKYSSGAAAHFAIGLQSDLSGDDRYNVGNPAVMNQFQGHARDGSIGISIDGDGNDRYQLVRNCGGSADLGSIGLLWDRRGDDTFDITYATDTVNTGWANTPALGTATSYPASNTFRDDLDAIGIFLDTGGRDTYNWTGPRHDVIRPRNDARWPWRRDPRSIGVGMDVP